MGKERPKNNNNKKENCSRTHCWHQFFFVCLFFKSPTKMKQKQKLNVKEPREGFKRKRKKRRILGGRVAPILQNVTKFFPQNFTNLQQYRKNKQTNKHICPIYNGKKKNPFFFKSVVRMQQIPALALGVFVRFFFSCLFVCFKSTLSVALSVLLLQAHIRCSSSTPRQPGSRTTWPRPSTRQGRDLTGGT